MQGKWLRQVVTGYFNYHAVPTNSPALAAFRLLRHRTLAALAPAPQSERRHDMGEDHTARQRLAPQTAHPSSLAASTLRRHTPEVGAVCGNPARTDLCGGRSAMSVPTANFRCSFNALRDQPRQLPPRNKTPRFRSRRPAQSLIMASLSIGTRYMPTCLSGQPSRLARARYSIISSARWSRSAVSHCASRDTRALRN